MIKRQRWIKEILFKILFLFVIIYLIIKWPLFKLYRFSKKHSYFIIGTIIGTFMLGLISNQAIQPLFTPRISETSVTPQYVINFGDNYEIVFKHSYIIDLPLFPSTPLTPLIGSNELDLKLPQTNVGQEKYILFIENNPYMQLLYDFDSEGRITYNKSTDVISANFTTDAWQVKSLNINLYLSEKIGQVWCYQDYNRPPNVTDEFPLDFRLFCNDYLGDYVYDLNEKKYYVLNIHEIRNIGDLGIKGYKYYVDDDAVQVCEKDIKLNIDDNINRKWVTFDLNSGETIKLISVRGPKKISPDETKQIHNLTTHYECHEISRIINGI